MNNNFKKYIFADGYACYVKGMSKVELRAEEARHGRLVKIEK